MGLNVEDILPKHKEEKIAVIAPNANIFRILIEDLCDYTERNLLQHYHLVADPNRLRGRRFNRVIVVNNGFAQWDKIKEGKCYAMLQVAKYENTPVAFVNANDIFKPIEQ